jgi:hypothetical protein
MEAGGHINDSLFVADYLLRLLRVLALLALWRVVMHGRGSVSGMSLGTLLTYTLAAEGFAEQLAARTYLEYMLWEGKLVTLLLEPMGLIAILTSQSAGRWLAGFAFFSLPLLLLAPVFGVNPLPATLASGLLFIVSLVLAIAVGLAVDFIFSSVTVTMGTSPWGIAQIRTASSCPGRLVPWH